MGLGHALVKMGYKYGSEEGNAQVDKIMSSLRRGRMKPQLSWLWKEAV